MGRKKMAEWITYTVRVPKEVAEPYQKVADCTGIHPAHIIRMMMINNKDKIEKYTQTLSNEKERLLKALK